MTVQGVYISQTDIELAISSVTLIQLTDDDGTGSANATVVQRLIDDAEGEAEGFIEGFYKRPLTALPGSVDRLFRRACVDFAVAFAFMRHPEYVRRFGEDPRASSLYAAACKRMMRIKEALQELPDTAPSQQTPYNVGGLVTASGPRMIIDGTDGTNNGGDF